MAKKKSARNQKPSPRAVKASSRETPKRSARATPLSAETAKRSLRAVKSKSRAATPSPGAVKSKTRAAKPSARAAGPNARTSKRLLKVATFNVNGLGARLAQLLQWLEKERPDVVCLQELKATSYPVEELQRAGYEGIWHGERSWNGVALLAKGTAVRETLRGLPGAGADSQSRYLEGEAHGITFAGIYLPNGNPQPGPKFDYKLAWFERLISRAAALWDSARPVVLLGDFNVVPTDFDIYNPRSWLKDALLQPESRECYARLLAQGWLDVLRARYPQERIYTFWDYFRRHWQTNSGLRIDHLLVSAPLASRVVDAGVDTWVRGLPKPSDHAPTWMTLELV